MPRKNAKTKSTPQPQTELDENELNKQDQGGPSKPNEEPEKEEREEADPTWLEILDMLKEALREPGVLEETYEKYLWGRVVEHPQQGKGVVKYSNPFLPSCQEMTTVTVMWAQNGKEETFPYLDVSKMVTSKFVDLSYVPWQLLEYQETTLGHKAPDLGGVFAPGAIFAPAQTWKERKAHEQAHEDKYQSEGRKQVKYPAPWMEPHRKIKQLPPLAADEIEELKAKAAAIPAVVVANVYDVLGQPDPKDRLTLPPAGTVLPQPKKKAKKAKVEKQGEAAATKQPKAKPAAAKKQPAAKAPKPKPAAAEKVQQASKGAAAEKVSNTTPKKAAAGKPSSSKAADETGKKRGRGGLGGSEAAPTVSPPPSKTNRPASWQKLLSNAPLAPATADKDAPASKKARAAPQETAEPASAKKRPRGQPQEAAAGTGEKPSRKKGKKERGDAPEEEAPVDRSQGVVSWTGRQYPPEVCYSPGDVTLHRRRTTGEGDGEADCEVSAVVDQVTLSKGRWRYPKQRTWYLLKWKGYELNPGDGKTDKGDWEPACNVDGCEALTQWQAAKPSYYSSVPDPEGL